VTRQPRRPGLLHHFSQGMQSEGDDVGAHIGMSDVQLLKLLRLIVIVPPSGLQMKLPAITRNGHLHDLGGAFVMVVMRRRA
jgi:hypothetical protein